ncbi:MAG: DUF1330 domain-containing protein [Alphaproteobacteria bacterium]|jgi:uncharacterized protein (DUF1330 family)|nr:DUF1330 domain-containing protein [Alphaproteobacteria bacterium]MDP6588475.1 DUF1330 domain-containing protein [Alphaproteobacteria bacterium]MDP6817834.1 DUF1330 domain-containing protein [Alphaproteobacteria bacterium]
MAAYVIVDSDIKNLEGMKEYIEKVGATLQPHGGQPLAAGTNIEVIEGGWNPSRIVVVAFPSVAAAKAWYNSPAYQEILPLRTANTDDKLILVEGL